MTERQTVTAEGRTLNEAIQLAATELGVDAAQVQHKLDAEHFRNAFGAMTGVDTVKIFAWVRDPAQFAGGEAARAWLASLIEAMGIDAKVKLRVRGDKQATIIMDSEKARFLVGRQGRTLNAIRHLLAESVGREYPDWTFVLDVTGGEERRESRDGDRRDRGERGDRGDRGERGDRGDRRGRRDRRGHGDDRRQRSEAELDGLRELALKIAHRVLESGKSEVIRKRLNSYERRVVHVAIADVEGVRSESVKHDGEKRIEIAPASDAGAVEE